VVHDGEKEGMTMINLTKDEFIKMIIRMTSTYHEDWMYSKVRAFANEVYQNSLPEGQGVMDRFVIGGYTVLLDKDVENSQLRDPQADLMVNFLLPQTGLREYLKKTVVTCGYTGDDVNEEVSRIISTLKRKGKRRPLIFE